MASNLDVLLGMAVGVGVVHTLVGVDHSLPFVALARARGWRWPKLMAVTGACGIGHVLSSVVIGGIGIGLGLALDSMVWLEGLRGHLAAYLTIGFGLAYAARAWWRQRMALREHGHHHGGPFRRDTAFWWLFIVFVLGPCEALIPMLMMPASLHDWVAVVLACVTFGAATLVTMLVAVSVGHFGLARLRLRGVEAYGDVLAGLAIAGSGVAVEFLGI